MFVPDGATEGPESCGWRFAVREWWSGQRCVSTWHRGQAGGSGTPHGAPNVACATAPRRPLQCPPLTHCLAVSNTVLSRYPRSVTAEPSSRSAVPQRFPRPPEPRGDGDAPVELSSGEPEGGGERGHRPHPRTGAHDAAPPVGVPVGPRVRQPLSPGVGTLRGRSPSRGAVSGEGRGQPLRAGTGKRRSRPDGAAAIAEPRATRGKRGLGGSSRVSRGSGERGSTGTAAAVSPVGTVHTERRRVDIGEALRDTCGPAPARPAVCGTAPVPSHRVPGADPSGAMRCGAARAQVCSAPSARPPGVEPPGTAPGFPARPVGARGRSGRGGAQPGDPGPVSVLLSGEAAISQ